MEQQSQQMQPPAAPARPFACYAATALRALVRDEGFDPDTALPQDLSRRIFRNGDIVSEGLWTHFATKQRPEQGQLAYRYCCYVWGGYVSQITRLPPGCEFLIAPPAMLGVDWLHQMIQAYDTVLFPNIGLDGCRSADFYGRVAYPEAEDAQAEERRIMVSRYGLSRFDRLTSWVMRFNELYGPYQPGVANDLAIPKFAELVALQLRDRNPDLF